LKTSSDGKLRRILYIAIVATLALAGCPAPRTLPDVPRVEFKSGDIGFYASPDSLNAPDTVKYNLFLTLHEMVNGVYREVDTSELGSPPYYRIPPLDREGQNKTLKGEISVDIEYFTIDYDTLRYSFYLFDRAYHRSNVDTTDEIIFTDWK
jgi:hypothetical protein